MISFRVVSKIRPSRSMHLVVHPARRCRFGVLAGAHSEEEGSGDEVGNDCWSGVDEGQVAGCFGVIGFGCFIGGSIFL